MEVKKYEKIILDSSRSIDDIVASVKAELSKQESKNAGESYICYVSHAYSSGDNAGANYIVVSDGFKELKRLSSNVIQISPYNKDEINELIATNISTKANANSVVNLTGEQTIEGVKTFSSVPVVATQPTNDNEVANKAYVDSKSSELNSRIDGVNNSLTNSINAKANSNAVVALSGNQTINGVKTFTSNITAPNITTLQNQMNGLAGLVSGVKVPYLLPNQNFIGIKVGANLNPNDFIDTDYKAFTNLVDTVTYLKKNFAISLDPFITIETHSEFNDDFTLSDLPPCTITAGYKFANNLHIRNCPNIVFGSLVLGGNLTVENSNITIIMGNIRGRVVDEYYSDEAFEKSSIVAINSTVIIAGYVQFYPSNDACSIVAKEGSQVIISNSIVYQNTPSRYFAYVESGGKIVSHGRGGLPSGLFEAKTNVAPNTLTPNGMILGSHWG